MRSKYFFILTLISLFVAVNVSQLNAQLVRCGVKVGADVSGYRIKSGINNIKDRTGFQVGGVVQFNVPLIGLGVETGLQYINKSYQAPFGSDGRVRNLTSLTVPLLLKRKMSFSDIVGVYFNVGLFGTMKLNGGELLLYGNQYEQKEIRTGLEAGGGILLVNHFELGAQYRYKFSDTYDQEVDQVFKDLDRQTWTVSLTYLF